MGRNLALVAVAAGVLALAPPAGAATWRAQRMAIPQTVQGTLFSVSCARSSACEGVGQTVDARGDTRALAEAWNGSRWKRQVVPSFDDPVTSLTSISCSGRDSCDAIGSFEGNRNGGVFAEYWNGSTWTVQLLPGVPGATAFLNAISCPGENACTAVGFAVNNKTGVEAPLVEVWNGSTWRVQKSPTPSGAEGAELTAVSCASATVCTAVGTYFQKNGRQPAFAESRVATTWQLEAVPVAAGTVAAVPSALSCSAADACTAVGSYLTKTRELGLAERWNGSTWSRETVPVPAGANNAFLSGVSCASASNCEAVGGAASKTRLGPLAERWNGSLWSAQTTPAEPGGSLGVVSCPSSSSCTAVGTPGPIGAADRLRPGSRLPRPGLLSAAPRVSSLGLRSRPPASGLTSRPGASTYALPRPAIPFGGSADRFLRARDIRSLTLVEHWNGKRWRVVPTPRITGAASSQAFGVSCGSAHGCFATGTYSILSGDELPLLERWNGARWKLASLPIPSRAVGARVFDVSCTAANACTAVGEAVTPSTDIAFADRWNGTTWTAQHVPGKTGLGTALGSVSCTAADACTAVGALLDLSTGTDKTLAEFWNGSRWTIQHTANKSGNTSNDLYSVSCTSARACMSAGSFVTNTASPSSGALSELWSANKWTLKSLPTPSNPQISIPDSVSCSGRRACDAVGSWPGSTSLEPFADGWNGTVWSPQKMPLRLPDLFAVGCVTSASCVAAGDSDSALWNGTSWSVRPLARPRLGQFPSLQGVTCTKQAICTGVGSAATSQLIPLAERYS